MTDEQVGAVGDEFARAYYTALVTDPATLRSLYGSRAKHLFLIRGREDISVHGPDHVQLFAARMGYDRCRVCVKSVDAIRVRENRFVVLVVGQMMCPWGSAPEGRKFVQSTVVRWCEPSRFSIIGTVFMFDDAINEIGCPEENAACTDDGDDRKPKSPTPSLTDTQALPPRPTSRNPRTVPPNIKNAECVHVARLPDSFGVDDLWTEFSRFGQVVGVNILMSPKRKGRSARYLHGVVWYDLPGTADAVIRFGTVTLANGDVVAVERVTKNVRQASGGGFPC